MRLLAFFAILTIAALLPLTAAHAEPLAAGVEPSEIVMPDLTPTDPTLPELDVVFGPSPQGRIVVVEISEQRLSLFENGEMFKHWPVSTSRYGIGNRQDSFKTPVGVHRVAEKIGADAPLGTLFKARQNMQQTVEIHTDETRSDEDHVTSRILWLDGLEPGLNKGEGVDSFSRFIYIHGTSEEGYIGTPASHGCVRMRNADVAELFDLLDTGTLVVIRE